MNVNVVRIFLKGERGVINGVYPTRYDANGIYQDIFHSGYYTNIFSIFTASKPPLAALHSRLFMLYIGHATHL
jgi:hypothetical protein